jgi:hypothetical protein
MEKEAIERRQSQWGSLKEGTGKRPQDGFRTKEKRHMTNQSSTDTNPSHVESTAQSGGLAKWINADDVILIALLALSAIGIAVTNIWPIQSFWFWAVMVPIFGASSIYMGWSKARQRGEGVTRILRIQLLHWIGLLATVLLIYFLFTNTSRIDSNQLALTTLIALALTTFLAGVHFDWRFMVIGIVLGAAVAVVAFMEQYIWVIIIPIVVAIGVIVFRWMRRA